MSSYFRSLSSLYLIVEHRKAVAAVLAIVALFSVVPAFAAPCTVTTNADSGPGSLRDRIADPGCDPIDFQAGLPSPIVLTSGELVIGRNLTISGPGANLLAISGNNVSRVFFISFGVTASISGVSILNGNGVGGSIVVAFGGGILNQGSAVISNSTVSGNSARSGGGISNEGGTLTVSNSTVSGNSASGSQGGGGINSQGQLTTVTNSTVSGNSSPAGGGIMSRIGTLRLINSTVSGNSGGNGIFNFFSAAMTVKNSIVANNLPFNCVPTGTFNSLGHNLSNDNSCSAIFNATGDLNNTPAGLDPLGLQNNGGSTQTIALTVGSAAIDAIPTGPANFCTAIDGTTPIATDQRGVTRPQGVGCDIGAYELVQDDVGPITTNVLATPNPVAMGVASALTANVDDSATRGSNILSASYTIDGGSPIAMSAADAAFDEVSEDVTASLAPFATTGVRSLCVRGTDVPGNVGDPACVLLPVYDPTGGFVTGGGIVNSPAGTDLANPSAEGLAKFGFVAKYLPGSTIPDGSLEFQAATLNFKSTSMEWLVVTGEPRAIFRGEGTINGTTVCRFEVDAWDSSFSGGGGDAFGLRIFECAGGGDRYSLPATLLTKGSIIIHDK